MIFGEVKLLAGLGLAAALFFAYQWKLHEAKAEGRDECMQQHTAAALEASQENQRLSRIAQDKSRENADGYRKELDRQRARSAAGDAELVRLRIAIDEASGSGGAASAPGSGLDPDGERLAALGGLLSEGAGLAEEGRRHVAELAAKTARLQTQLGLMCVTPAAK